MRTVNRVLIVLAVSAASLVAVVPMAQASPVDCTYTKSKKLVTITIDNVDTTGELLIERGPGTNRIGYRIYTWSDNWIGCEGARTTDTDKIKVVGSSLSDEIWISLEQGSFTPGATPERTGASEVEFVLDLGAGTDRVVLLGGRANDRLGFPKPSQATLNGDTDIDATLTEVEQWELDGGLGDDVLDGRGALLLVASGREGGDRLIGGSGPDTLQGDESSDAVGDGQDTLIGGGGRDYLYGGQKSDVLDGGDGDDYFYGDEGNDALIGGPGDDDFNTLSARDGADRVDGGSGYDDLDYFVRTTAVRVSLDGRANDGGKGESDNVAGSVEEVRGGSAGDTLIGNDAQNVFSGVGGGDVLKGLGGDDALDAGDGNDDVYGGAGDERLTNTLGEDRYIGGDGDDSINAGSFTDGRDVFSGGNGWDELSYGSRVNPLDIDLISADGDGETGENDNVLADFERISGGSGSDTIRGSGRGEAINGGGSLGSDALYGRGGSDTLEGNDGDDLLVGGEGYDRVYGGTGEDAIDSFDEGEDYVDCGSGVTDTVSAADVFDSIVNCDIVPI